MEVLIRTEGRAGRITLNRPEALNALSHPMSLAIEAALDGWRDDPGVALVLIDAEGTRAFCAGGDIATIHAQITAGDLASPRKFWRDEYRMNAKIAEYPKPVVALMQGFVMGGGVGIGCHAGIRIVGKTTRVAMPECAIGLIPDVGGSLLLARAPGRFGAYLGLTGTRMGPGDAIDMGFADLFVPEAEWPDLAADLARSGDPGVIADYMEGGPAGRLRHRQERVDAIFSAATVAEILARLDADGTEQAVEAAAAMRAASPLSLAVTLECQRRLGRTASVREALALEYRFTWRAPEASDLVEGIRALIVDKDRRPRWRHPAAEAVGADEVAALLAPLGADELVFEEKKA